MSSSTNTAQRTFITSCNVIFAYVLLRSPFVAMWLLRCARRYGHCVGLGVSCSKCRGYRGMAGSVRLKAPRRCRTLLRGHYRGAGEESTESVLLGLPICGKGYFMMRPGDIHMVRGILRRGPAMDYIIGQDPRQLLKKDMFDGEKDTRTPVDFNNNKVEEVVDEDDDGDDDDATRQGKRRDSLKQPKVKIEGGPNAIPIRPVPAPVNDLTINTDLDFRSNPRVSPAASTSSSSIPISGERHITSATSATRSVPISSSKRQRLAHNSPDDLHGIHSTPAVGGSPSFPYRLEVELPPYPPLPQAHTPHPSLSALYPGAGGGSMSNIMSSQHTHPATFLPQAPFDLNRNQPLPTLRTVTFPSSASSSYSHPPPPQPQQQQQQQQAHSMFSHHRQSQPQHGNSVTSNFLADLLSATPEHANTPHGQFPSFDWPVHTQQSHESSHAASSAAENNWFDLFSTSPTTGAGLTLPPRPSSNSINSSRSLQGYGMSPSSASSPGTGRKRLRDDEGAGMSVSVSGSEYNEDDGDDEGARLLNGLGKLESESRRESSDDRMKS
ncbi:hypothetical protein A0H81_06187 [Grifola frondosa]|uniref:Uncharacterized protein n=1 Tax=Grifola frondosa TaxID=5627 RepID=A0A1C7MA13_GRIFR|nr:hypothetical protein A0H81_06187 [Grifola frondosa]